MIRHATVFYTDPPTPVKVKTEATADNTSIRVSWEWSCQGVLPDLVRVHYQPKGGSLMMYTVDNTTATSATLPNLQCYTKYTFWVYVERAQTGRTSVSRMAPLPARGMQYAFHIAYSLLYMYLYYCITFSHSHSH